MEKINESCSKLRVADILLRVISILLSITTICLIATNKQDDSIYGKLVFTNLMGLKYMVCISAISVGYGLLAAVFLWVVRFLLSHHARILFVSDQMVAYLMVTSAASLVEIIYLAYNGDQNVTWSEACNINYGNFCKRLKLAMAFHVISLCCFCMLAMISAYRLFTRFDPPFVPPDERTDIDFIVSIA